MPKTSDSIGIKISELGDAGVIKENDVVPINAKTSEGVPFTKSTKINDLRQTLGFENAFLSVDAGLNGTVSGDVFFVYESAAKLWVLQYQNNDGVANPVLGYDNNQVRLPTNRQLKAVSGIADPTGYSQIGKVESFDTLRKLTPAYEGQRVLLKSYYKDGLEGGGEFIGRLSSAVDDSGVIAAGEGFYWERLFDKTKKEINVLWFGADPTGTSSSTTAFQAALNFLTTGGRIIVPAGKYSIRTLTYTYDYTEIVGAGVNKTVLFSPAPSGRGWMIRMNDLTECALRNLTMDSLYTSVEGSFWMGGGIRCVVDSCSFLNGHYCTVSINGATGISGGRRYAYDNRVTNCYAKGQRNYHPTGTSPFIAGNGAAYTVFENCIVEDCNADAYDADSAPYTIFRNCIARQNGETRSTFAGFWSEGLVSEFSAQTGFSEYVVFWENCRAEGYQIGIGSSEDVKAVVTNPMMNKCNRGLWLRTDATVDGGLISNCGVASSQTEVPLYFESSVKITGTKCTGTVSSGCVYVYNATYSTTTPSVYDNVTFDGRVYIYTGNSSRFIDFTNCVFLKGGISWYNTGSNTYLISNCLFIDSVITGARCKHARVANCIFIDNNNTLTAITNTLDTYNTYVYDCHFDGFSVVSTTATLGKNTYLNCTTNPSITRDYVIKTQLTLTNAGEAVNIPMGAGFARGTAIIIAQGASNDNASGVYAISATSNTSTRTITPLVETAEANGGNKFVITWPSGAGPAISHPVAGRVVNITVLNYN